jgi:plasmid stability protein
MLASRTPGSSSRVLLGLLVMICVLACGARTAPAQDIGAARRDITDADDFRLRVRAALLLGKSHEASARPLLELALSDSHPAVRTAAAAGLAAYGDPGAIAALQRHANDASSSVRAQIQTSIDALQKGSQPAAWQGIHFVVQLGDMRNRTGIRGDQPSGVLRNATRAQAAALPGAMVTDGNDPQLLIDAANRHMPVVAIDGSLQRLTQGQHDSELRIVAQVEFSMRRMPEQSLKGVLSGAATSIGSTTALANPALVTQLENQAISGAVESAMRGAAQGFAQATK